MSKQPSEIRLVGIDWGTTNLRAWAFDHRGEIVETRSSDKGILNVADGGFEFVLMDLVADWIAGDERIPLIASGMITSRQGWIEIEYLSCPIKVSELVNQNVQRRLECGNSIMFISGVRYEDDGGLPDVMRGEETQIAGLLAQRSRVATDVDGPITVVLPGTHSKWVYVDEQHRIVEFKTFMTGELYALLSKQSILSHSIEQAPAGSADTGRTTETQDTAFERGIESVSQADGQLLNRLFHTRTLSLSGRLTPSQASEYLSGMLVGSELHEGLRTAAGGENQLNSPRITSNRSSINESTERATGTIVLVGDGALVQRYARAFHHLGCSFETAPMDTTARGLWLQYQSLSERVS